MTGSAPMASVSRPAWPWRIVGWIATFAAVLALGYVIAYWGWRWLGPTAVPAAIPALPERLAQVIVAVPLFGRAEAPAPASAAPAANQGDSRLLGVFAGDNGKGQALFRLPDRGPVLVGSGEDIANEVTLLEVRPDGVRIRDHGETRDLRLRTGATTAQAPPGARASGAACAAPAGYTGPVYRINAELLTGIAARPDGWKMLLGPVPGGLALKDGSPAASMLGMKAGDRLVQANGIALKGVEDLLVAFVKPLVASQPVYVAGLRDGKPASWFFVNAGACPG
jgi:Type II secretion system protein C